MFTRIFLIVFIAVCVSDTSWAMGMFKKRSGGSSVRGGPSNFNAGSSGGSESFGSFSLLSGGGDEGDEGSPENFLSNDNLHRDPKIDVVDQNPRPNDNPPNDPSVFDEVPLPSNNPPEFQGPEGQDDTVAIPEPATLTLMGMGLAGMYFKRRKK